MQRAQVACRGAALDHLGLLHRRVELRPRDAIDEVHIELECARGQPFGAFIGFGERLERRAVERLGLKFAPRLKFLADDSFDEAGRIERLLSDPRVARDLGDLGED